MKELLEQRKEAMAQLVELIPKMLIGSVSETYRTCGSPTCRCHTTGPKHGPHLYVSYRGEHGRTTGYYVPKALHQNIRDGLLAWKEFQTVARKVAHLNKEIIRDSETPSKGGKRRK